ncbi:NAD(P)/FAD-dependent oxidoreductase [Actinokineospora sp. G85]|uniref:NAD(P)/FAD-dependent oxidoreductase n=1 Tax=Actinokineospora sp. G85 TaxID=3406626 RepID=UPI003C74131C
MHDIIIVGARCAGAPTAMLFARAGYRVLLLDRATFPRDTLSTLYIHQPGIALLDRWGLRETLVESGAPPITSALHQVEDVVLRGCCAPVNGIRAAFAPRRLVLDQILLDAAVAAGVEFRQGHGVDEVLFDPAGRAVGVRCGAERLTARLVVGADGMRSRVAAAVGAEVEVSHPELTCVYYSFFAGVPAGFEAYGGAGTWAGCVPTHDGLTLVGAYFPQADYARVRHAAQEEYLANIRRACPDLHERVMAGTQEERLYGSGAQRNFFRRASGPGWALVGDAGHHKDSILANGITDAFRQAELLVSCVDQDLHDEPALAAALARFARERARLFTAAYRNTLAVARLEPARRLPAMRAMADDPAQVELFFTKMAGATRDDDLLRAAPALTARPPA